METWLVPIAGTRVMVPVRVVIPTPLGQGVLQATQLYVHAAAGPRDHENAIAACIIPAVIHIRAAS